MVTIVWDLDDVLNDLMQVWFTENWKPRHPECALSFSEITENPPERLLGIERSEYLAAMDEFRASARARDLRPNPLVVDWLERSGRQSRHIALTARPLSCTPEAAEWLFRHFGSYIRAFGVVPSRPPAEVPAYDANKADFLRWFRHGDILVDDSEINIRAAENLGVRGILYPQPWNSSSQTPEAALETLSRMAKAR